MVAVNLLKLDFDPKNIKPGAKVILKVTRVDNKAEIRINDYVVYDRSLHHDPELNDLVDLTPHMAVGRNYLDVKLWNWSGSGENPWHIAYQVLVDGQSVVETDARSQGSSAAGLAYTNRHELFVGRQ